MSRLAVGRVPALRQLPSLLRGVDRGTALFESWHGEYSDNPRAISETMATTDPEIRQLWASGAAPIHHAFEPNGLGYLNAIARAGYVFTNLNMPDYFRKPADQTYVQTWHGTPLKRIAFDIERPSFRGGRDHLEAFTRDVAKWDVLVSPNRFSTDVFRRAFRYDGRVIETGYPRNDSLSSPDADASGLAVRRALGVPEDARVLLYAPTWRDNESFSLELDLAALSQQLGDEYVVLLRAHRHFADAVLPNPSPRVVNVSDYSDIRELYLAADVLVTDYSSAMFDFAVTRKPMLFYTYDLAEYRDKTRGFYFDFESEAPGPLLATAAELYEALRGLDGVVASYQSAYAEFTSRFCYLEDGKAAERVIDAVVRP